MTRKEIGDLAYVRRDHLDTAVLERFTLAELVEIGGRRPLHREVARLADLRRARRGFAIRGRVPRRCRRRSLARRGGASHRSDGCNPVCFAIRASMRGPISSLS